MKKVILLIAVIFSASLIFAESVTCENENGACEFNEDGSFSCECVDHGFGANGVGSTGGEGDYTLPTQEECLATIEEFCGLPEGTVTCENPAGKCIVSGNGDFSCSCEDGTDVWGGEGTEPEEPGFEGMCMSDSDCEEGEVCFDGACTSIIVILTEANECKEILENYCGTEAPDINKICTEETFDYCTDGFALFMEKCENVEIAESVFEEMKNAGWGEYGKEIASCCYEYDDFKADMDELLECLKEKSCEECIELAEDIGKEKGDIDSGGGDEPADSTNNDSESDGSSGSVSKSDESSDDKESDKDDKESKEEKSSSGCSAVVL
ncbi:MAG: hypothetical protein ACOX2F_03685 [bacterium]